MLGFTRHRELTSHIITHANAMRLVLIQLLRIPLVIPLHTHSHLLLEVIEKLRNDSKGNTLRVFSVADANACKAVVAADDVDIVALVLQSLYVVVCQASQDTSTCHKHTQIRARIFLDGMEHRQIRYYPPFAKRMPHSSRPEYRNQTAKTTNATLCRNYVARRMN